MAAKKRKHQEVLTDVKRLLKEIEEKKFKPLYVLHGEEPYYVDLLTNAFAEKVLEPEQRDFNQTVVYGHDTEPSSVASAARQYPVMAPHLLIIAKEAQVWRKWDDLLPVLKNPVSTSVVVICLKEKTLDKRTAFYKEAVKSGEVFESVKISDRELIPAIEQMCKSRKIAIEPKAAAMIADHIGTNLIRLTAAAEKLALMCRDRGTVTDADVSKHIGISKDFNVFEFNRAVGMRDSAKALKIANYFASNQKEHNIIPTVSNMYGYFKKIAIYHESPEKGNDYALAGKMGIPPFFIGEYRDAARRYNLKQVVGALEILHETDLKAKGVGSTGSDGGALVKELAARILRL